MTLEEEIKDLQQQRDAHLRDATYLFARTKRDVRRKLSPDRMVRRNIGVAIAAAAVGAMLLAPGPRREKKQSVPIAEAKSGMASGWRAALRGLLPAPFQKLMGSTQQPPAANGQQAEQKRTKSLLELLVAELLTVAARQVNWTALLHQLMQRFSPAEHDEGSNEEPRVAVADVGTTPSDQVLDGKVRPVTS